MPPAVPDGPAGDGGRTAVRVLYAGSLLLLMAYVGSRFVLEVILVRPS